MLIVGAIPTQIDRFVIPNNFVPIFIERIFGITWYKKHHLFIKKY